jgi:hypothetical protein
MLKLTENKAQTEVKVFLLLGVEGGWESLGFVITKQSTMASKTGMVF